MKSVQVSWGAGSGYVSGCGDKTTVREREYLFQIFFYERDELEEKGIEEGVSFSLLLLEEEEEEEIFRGEVMLIGEYFHCRCGVCDPQTHWYLVPANPAPASDS